MSLTWFYLMNISPSAVVSLITKLCLMAPHFPSQTKCLSCYFLCRGGQQQGESTPCFLWPLSSCLLSSWHQVLSSSLVVCRQLNVLFGEWISLLVSLSLPRPLSSLLCFGFYFCVLVFTFNFFFFWGGEGGIWRVDVVWNLLLLSFVVCGHRGFV